VHRQTYKDANDKAWITIKEVEMCPTALYTIYRNLKATIIDTRK